MPRLPHLPTRRPRRPDERVGRMSRNPLRWWQQITTRWRHADAIIDADPWHDIAHLFPQPQTLDDELRALIDTHNATDGHPEENHP